MGPRNDHSSSRAHAGDALRVLRLELHPNDSDMGATEIAAEITQFPTSLNPATLTTIEANALMNFGFDLEHNRQVLHVRWPWLSAEGAGHAVPSGRLVCVAMVYRFPKAHQRQILGATRRPSRSSQRAAWRTTRCMRTKSFFLDSDAPQFGAKHTPQTLGFFPLPQGDPL